jgi:hypothetical protein
MCNPTTVINKQRRVTAIVHISDSYLADKASLATLIAEELTEQEALEDLLENNNAKLERQEVELDEVVMEHDAEVWIEVGTNTETTSLITSIDQAAKADDLDSEKFNDALADIQERIGQDDGGFAGAWFSEYKPSENNDPWKALNHWQREEVITEYIKAELKQLSFLSKI